MVNTCVVAGRLVRDMEVRHLPTGKPVGTFTLAVDRQYKDKDGNKQTDFIDCVVWGERAEKLTQYLTKGKPLAVTGSLQTRSYEDKNGVKRKAWEINVNELRFLPDGRGNGNSNNQQQRNIIDTAEGISFDEDSIPF